MKKPTFEARVEKLLGKKWDKISPDDRKIVRDISECQSSLKAIYSVPDHIKDIHL